MSYYASAGNKKSGVAIMLSSFREVLPDNSIVSAVSMLITTKKDKTAHGFGVASVKMLAEKYNGMTSFYERNGQFIADVWLKLSDL